MTGVVKRGLKLYYKDKASVFFSLLGVLINFMIFALFIQRGTVEELMVNSTLSTELATGLANAWIIAGLIAVASVTTGMGALEIMIADRERGQIKDLMITPLKDWQITGGYMLTSYTVSVIMSVGMCFIGELYIVANGGRILNTREILHVLCIILLAGFSSSAFICFMTSLLRSISSFSTASILLGSLVGFLIGNYIPVGFMPSAIQYIVKCFPVSHAAVLLRQILMQDVFQVIGDTEMILSVKQVMGVEYYSNGKPEGMAFHLAVLVITGLVFFALASRNMKRKK